MLNIAISGANGFVGQKLSTTLLSDPAINLIKLGRRNANQYDNFIDIETSNSTDITHQLNNFDCLIHLAARAHTRNATEQDFQRDNINLSIQLAEIARNANIKQFIYLSSIKVLGNASVPGKPFSVHDTPNPKDIYGKSKLASELAIKERLQDCTTDFTIIRPPLVWGAGCKGNLKLLIDIINKGIPLPFGAIKNKRDIISIENLCSLICHTILHPKAMNHTFLVSDGQTRTTRQISILLEKFTIRKAKFLNTPQTFFKMFKYIPALDSKIESFLDNLEIDTTETERLLGWKPTN